MKSRIFTDGEMKELNRKLAGGKHDPNGAFYNRVKPKIIELLDHWFPRKKQLKKLIKPKINKKGTVVWSENFPVTILELILMMLGATLFIISINLWPKLTGIIILVIIGLMLIFSLRDNNKSLWWWFR